MFQDLIPRPPESLHLTWKLVNVSYIYTLCNIRLVSGWHQYMQQLSTIQKKGGGGGGWTRGRRTRAGEEGGGLSKRQREGDGQVMRNESGKTRV